MKAFLVMIVSGVLLACSPRADPAQEQAWRDRGAAAVAGLKQSLIAELSAALAAGGPENALDVCRVRAPALAAEASGSGVRVGRTSHKLRNPDNAPPDWVTPLLQRYVAGELANEPTVVALDGGRGGYVEPLFAAPMCLTCHGEVVAPAVAKKLEALYPDDRAIGFRAGELRGLAWAEIDAPDRS
jgi:Protein of unknown function (DUF3365)